MHPNLDGRFRQGQVKWSGDFVAGNKFGQHCCQFRFCAKGVLDEMQSFFWKRALTRGRTLLEALVNLGGHIFDD